MTKKNILCYYPLFLILTCFIFTSCIHKDDYDTSPQTNFDALWKILDEHYCYFPSKGIEWNSIYKKYQPYIQSELSEEELFGVLSKMLDELQDGHVNLSSIFNTSRYWKWYLDYPDNFDEKIQRNYLEDDYFMTSGIKYKILDDNIGYMHYNSFLNGIGEGNLDYIISKFSICQGIIIDVRDNSGGELTNVNKLASRFTNEKVLVGYSRYKTGKGHDDFSDPEPKYIEPANRIRYQKTVVVLTNRRCYSATNEFINAMHLFKNITIIGDKTGGGGGLPFSSELPNGWTIRFSACPNYNAEMEDIEFGIDPDIKVDMTKEDMDKGLDTIIEEARKYIVQQENKQ